jgi:hypothetical protein
VSATSVLYQCYISAMSELYQCYIMFVPPGVRSLREGAVASACAVPKGPSIVVLHWCYSGVAMVLQWWRSGVTVVVRRSIPDT